MTTATPSPIAPIIPSRPLQSPGQPPTEDHPLADSLVYSLAVQELLITITTQSAANEPGLGWAVLGWGGVGWGGVCGGCQRGAEKGRTGHRLVRTALYRSASIGRNVGHPPAFPLCLTLNLVAGMRKGRRQQQQWKKRRREEEVEKVDKAKERRRERRQHLFLHFVCIFLYCQTNRNNGSCSREQEISKLMTYV